MQHDVFKAVTRDVVWQCEKGGFHASETQKRDYMACARYAGHTPGSMSYLMNDSILFVGDTLALKGGKVRPFSLYT